MLVSSPSSQIGGPSAPRLKKRRCGHPVAEHEQVERHTEYRPERREPQQQPRVRPPAAIRTIAVRMTSAPTKSPIWNIPVTIVAKRILLRAQTIHVCQRFYATGVVNHLLQRHPFGVA